MTTFYKDTAETLDYTVNWATALGSDTIATSSWIVPSPMTKVSDSFTTTSAIAFLTGGSVGQSYAIINTVTTAGGDTLTQTFTVVINRVVQQSGVLSLSVSNNDIILMAYEDMGVYAPGAELPTAGEMATARKRLNMMVKAWQAAGVGLWLNTEYELTLVAGRMKYSIGPGGDVLDRPLGIPEARRCDTSGNETPMTPLSRDEYMALPLKSSTGPPVNYYYDYQTPVAYLSLWPVATDLTDVIKFTGRKPVQVFVNIPDEPDFPQEWFDALHFNLALRLSPAFTVPPQRYAMIKEQAAITLQDADGFDREQDTSLYFQPASGPGR